MIGEPIQLLVAIRLPQGQIARAENCIIYNRF
jgi:hypothetical protein